MKAMNLLQKLFLLTLLVITVSAKAQSPSFSAYITNETLISPTVYQFDIYLLSTGNATFQYAASQWGFSVNPIVANGGVLTATVVSASTMLSNTAQANVTAQLPASTFNLNVAAKAPPGTGNGSIISSVNGGCASPGTRIVTVRITNTVPFAKNTTMDHQFSFNTLAGVTGTKVFAYVNNLNTDVTPNGMFYGYNTSGTCTQNIVLNPDVATGVNNINSTSGYFNVYPNPTSGPVQIMFLGKSNSHYRLSLIDTIDREVWTNEGTAAKGDNKVTYDLKGLAKGVYMMTLNMDGQTSQVRTIIQ
jgi:hypothetical protein